MEFFTEATRERSSDVRFPVSHVVPVTWFNWARASGESLLRAVIVTDVRCVCLWFVLMCVCVVTVCAIVRDDIVMSDNGLMLQALIGETNRDSRVLIPTYIQVNDDGDEQVSRARATRGRHVLRRCASRIGASAMDGGIKSQICSVTEDVCQQRNVAVSRCKQCKFLQ